MLDADKQVQRSCLIPKRKREMTCRELGFREEGGNQVSRDNFSDVNLIEPWFYQESVKGRSQENRSSIKSRGQ